MYTKTKHLEDGRIEIKADLVDVLNLVAKNAINTSDIEDRLIQCYIQDGNLVIQVKP